MCKIHSCDDASLYMAGASRSLIFPSVACCQPIRGHSLFGLLTRSRSRSSLRAAQLFNRVQRGGDVFSAREPWGIDFGIACMLFRYFSNSKCDDDAHRLNNILIPNENVFRAIHGVIEQSSARRLEFRFGKRVISDANITCTLSHRVT